jgi:hypothetical protein
MFSRGYINSGVFFKDRLDRAFSFFLHDVIYARTLSWFIESGGNPGSISPTFRAMIISLQLKNPLRGFSIMLIRG